jgi:potassium-transporting ATPase KdpC subunit
MTLSFLRGLRGLLVFSVLTGILYPLLFTGASQVILPGQADGSLVEVDGRVVGSELIGQAWEGEEWFYGRPTGVDYDASASAGVNLGPLSMDLSAMIEERAAAIVELESPYREQTEVADIPVDLLTSSSSGLDPHISVEGATFQAPRIAEIRRLELSEVEGLIEEHSEARTLGVWGQERVNVLQLNLALEGIART